MVARGAGRCPLSHAGGSPGSAARARHIRVRRVLTGVLVANLAVLGSKLFVGILSGSLAILGGALDSAVDVLNNALGVVLVRVAGQAPDEEHPYGHEIGRAHV